jgi:hypothetical protein
MPAGKQAIMRYPHSANLFKFCRRVLDQKFGGIRVIDQDVGQILGFDPADCSHWKKGKKNIRSIQAMRMISSHLGVDERLVTEIAAGEIDDLEGYYEFTGYGLDTKNPDVEEKAKKDFYRKNAGTWSSEKERTFKDFFQVDPGMVARVVSDIHERIDFGEAPLYLPEVIQAFPEIRLRALLTKPEETTKRSKRKKPTTQLIPGENCVAKGVREGDNYVIEYAGGSEIRPFIRFHIARELGRYLLAKSLDSLVVTPELEPYRDHMIDVHCNLFAALLLAPEVLIHKELASLDTGRDIVAQLAEVFWVSRRFMNHRLKQVFSK